MTSGGLLGVLGKPCPGRILQALIGCRDGDIFSSLLSDIQVLVEEHVPVFVSESRAVCTAGAIQGRVNSIVLVSHWQTIVRAFAEFGSSNQIAVMVDEGHCQCLWGEWLLSRIVQGRDKLMYVMGVLGHARWTTLGIVRDGVRTANRVMDDQMIRVMPRIEALKCFGITGNELPDEGLSKVASSFVGRKVFLSLSVVSSMRLDIVREINSRRWTASSCVASLVERFLIGISSVTNYRRVEDGSRQGK